MQGKEPEATLRIPPRTVPADVHRGVYATQIQELTTGTETMLDFIMVAPATYDVDESGRLDFGTVQLRSEVVARVIVPSPLLTNFVRNYLRGHPDVLEPESVDAQGDRDGSESSVANEGDGLQGI